MSPKPRCPRRAREGRPPEERNLQSRTRECTHSAARLPALKAQSFGEARLCVHELLSSRFWSDLPPSTLGEGASPGAPGPVRHAARALPTPEKGRRARLDVRFFPPDPGKRKSQERERGVFAQKCCALACALCCQRPGEQRKKVAEAVGRVLLADQSLTSDTSFALSALFRHSAANSQGCLINFPCWRPT